MKLSQEQWNHFVDFADTYYGPKTIGELFCDFISKKDPLVLTADRDSVWQIIFLNYVQKEDQ
jgi:hypothetical protein